MILFRLATIIITTIRFGLDEIVVRAFAPTWLRRTWLLIMFWRPVRRSRANRLHAALEHLGPIFVKFGQVLSTRQDVIPADIAKKLALLQDKVQPQPFVHIEEVLNKSYGRKWTEVFRELEPESLGSASVAQVHKAVLHDGTSVAVKILRPNIRQQVERDINLMSTFANLVVALHPESRRLRPRALVHEFKRSLLEETDLLHEAANCVQLGRNFSDSDKIKTPQVYWNYCTKDVMVMELMTGIHVDRVDELRAAGIDLENLAQTGITLFFTQVFRDSFFHADMHPGNIFVDLNGRFIMLDHGIMGSLEDIDKEYIGANFLAFFNRDYRRVAKMHIEAGWIPGDTSVSQFEAAIRAVCEPIFARPLREISFGRLLMQLFQVARTFNLIVQPQLILLQKTLLNIEGLGRHLAPDLNLWDSAKPFLANWAREQKSPRRLAAIIQETIPSLVALLPELPQAAKASLAQAKTERKLLYAEQERLGKAARNWRYTSLALTLLTVWLLLG